ncbi:alpha-L-fucosidase [Lunatimonas salinarum]|uniref:alpha-L-fucosidase n=1 Tax=Lunatimonas salinarum TaxID=1774590 RepID=UPI001ADFC260|nr:alpha-L-fucosidase [Lunatimonas salinarum]
MITIRTRLALLFLVINVSFSANAQEKLRRSQSFFGFHFDFHATEKDKDLGKFFDTGLLDEFLERTRPDYIQVDSKGHPGYSSYPTNVGYSTNSFVNDPLKIWREVTDKHNLPLYVHYSGLWDDKAIAQNPDWGRIHADGTKDKTYAAYFSDYSNKFLIPQIKEMIDEYSIDGVWIDGDCWSTGPDYSPELVKGFLKETGLKAVPKSPEEEHYKKWLDYNRSAYRKYVNNYVTALHDHDPDFQVASNWAYSSMMPERVDVGVDFLSGDVSGQNGMYSAAFQARCLALQGKPWDLMAWGFVAIDFMGGIHSPKSLVQLKQEASEVMAMGGGFQVYFQQNRDASFQTLDVEALADLASFCRARQPFSQHSETIPQIGLWYSLEGWKQSYDGVYGWSSNMEGLTSAFMDGQHSIEILMDHHMEERLEQYHTIVIPEWSSFDEEIKGRLLNHVENGGNLFVIGAKAVRAFRNELQVDFIGADSTAQFNIGDRELGGIAGLRTQWQPVAPRSGTETIGHIYQQRDYRFPSDYPVATINAYGKGKIAGIYMDMSTPYATYRNPVFNNLINDVMERLVSNPTLKVEGSEKVHVVLGKKDEATLIHLINSDGEHFNKSVLAYNELRPTPPLQVTLNVAQKPKQVTLRPDNQTLPFNYEDNTLVIQAPGIDVYGIVEVVY